MEINFKDKIRVLLSVYSILNRLPTFTKKVALFFRPIDAVRYIEFAYIKKFIEANKLKDLKVLDLSSPYILSYILSKHNTVIKTDIDSSERKFIKENDTLFFRIEDATALTFKDNTFNLVYSISVIEHIYEKYIDAIIEMLRVVTPGGFVYITFPVSNEYKEEWVKGAVYEMQHKQDGKTFFQYRFDESSVQKMLHAVKENNGVIVQQDIFWESTEGAYDGLVEKIKQQKSNIYFTFIKNVLANFFYGFTMFTTKPAHSFAHSKSLGNMHIIIKKQ